MAIAKYHLALLFFLVLSSFPPKSAFLNVEKEALLEFKSLLKDPTNNLSSWDDSNSPCEFFGVFCDQETEIVTGILLENVSLVGELSPSLCGLQGLTSLVLTSSSISGNIPLELSQCSSLRSLNLSFNELVGRIPDLSRLRNLNVLDLSANNFTGEFPSWVGNLTGLVSLTLQNIHFTEGRIPEALGNLKKLRLLCLSNCTRVGEIPESIFGLTELETLDLSTNRISGTLHKSISNLSKVTKIELYSNSLTGEIPLELANLTLLQEFDISSNHFYGKLPSEIGNLNWTVFEVKKNHFTGELPPGFGDLQYLKGFSIYQNSFSGEFPPNFGRFSPLTIFDISENNFTGPFPSKLCGSQRLQFLLALDNDFSGEFPTSYSNCKSIVRLRVNKNRLSGRLPDGIWEMPNAHIMDFSDNYFTGQISAEIGNSASLSQLILENNEFSGLLPSELGKLTKLERLYLSNNSFSGEIPHLGALKQLSSLQLQGNLLSGSIPLEIGQCMRLVDLNLANNLLSGNIPGTFVQMSSLDSLNLSNNRLTGPIPNSLGKLKLSLIDLSKNHLSGSIPPYLLQVGSRYAFLGNKGLCIDENLKINYGIRVCKSKRSRRERLSNKLMMTSFFLFVLVVVLAGLLLMKCKRYKVSSSCPEDDLEGKTDMGLEWKVESFQYLEFDVDEICNLKEENLIGSGGTGKVYRLDLRKNGQTVAVKQLRKETGFRVLFAEMDILGKIRHRNVLKLYACLLRGGTGFLIFEFMEKGNLFQALHREIEDGQPELDWHKRYKVALGIAKGLAYLHHDCSPPIIHRDIKSTNILLDDDYEPKIADFGVAKATKDSPDGSKYSCFVGTHGYMAPELAYTSKVTERSDVYSFGVVLLELVTGRSPIEEEYGEGKDIVCWVLSQLNDQKGETCVLDHRVVSQCIGDKMMKVLKIATLCTLNVSSLRPTMRDVVKMLVDIDPCSFRSLTGQSDQTEEV